MQVKLTYEDDLFGRVGIEVEFLDIIIVLVLVVLQALVLSA
jgi:hypothetical protein